MNVKVKHRKTGRRDASGRKPWRERLHKTPVTIYLEPERAAALERLSVETRIPRTIFVREAVDMLLAKYQRQ